MGKFSGEKVREKTKEIAAQRKRQKKKSSSRFARRLVVVDGKNYFRFKETATESEFPWEEMGIHYNCGPDRKAQIRCIRDHVEENFKGFEPFDLCPQCLSLEEDRKRGGAKAKARLKLRYRKQRCLLEGINLTPLHKFFEDDEKKFPKPRECFGNYIFREEDEGHDVCEKCVAKTSWGKVCQSGLGYLTVGPTVRDPLISMANKIHKEIGHNPFSITEGHNFEFSRSGEKIKTTYSDVGFSLTTFILPKVVRKYMSENALDWSIIYPKLTSEEILAVMKGVELEPDEDLDEDEDLNEEEKTDDLEEEGGEEDGEEEESAGEKEGESEEEKEEGDEDEEFFNEIDKELSEDEDLDAEEEAVSSSLKKKLETHSAKKKAK